MHFFEKVDRSVCTNVFRCLCGLNSLLVLTAWCPKEEIHAL